MSWDDPFFSSFEGRSQSVVDKGFGAWGTGDGAHNWCGNATTSPKEKVITQSHRTRARLTNHDDLIPNRSTSGASRRLR